MIGPYWLSDFMAGYTVENMSFAPADSYDLQRLLASTAQEHQSQGVQGQGQGSGSGMGGGMTGMGM